MSILANKLFYKQSRVEVIPQQLLKSIINVIWNDDIIEIIKCIPLVLQFQIADAFLCQTKEKKTSATSIFQVTLR